jgi:hypothetical protein
MWTHQYDQMSNQIACQKFPGKSLFRTNDSDAHLFGLEPHYGCCTANFGQGWPKLALSTFMRARDGVVSAIPLASVVNFKYRGANIEVSLETDYPFKNSFTYRVKSDKKTSMKLHVRIPSFAKNIKVNGESVSKRQMLNFGGFEAGETLISVSYDVSAALISRPGGMYTARRGSLLFSVPVDFESKKVEYTRAAVERKFPYCDYHLKRISDWNYGFCDGYLSVERHPVSEIPFSSENPAVTVKAKFKKIDWGFEDGYDTVCAKVPGSTKPIGEEEIIDMYPYGCAKLRMTEMPFVEE